MCLHPEALTWLAAFRQEFYAGLGHRQDSLFELLDAVLTAPDRESAGTAQPGSGLPASVAEYLRCTGGWVDRPAGRAPALSRPPARSQQRAAAVGAGWHALAAARGG